MGYGYDFNKVVSFSQAFEVVSFSQAFDLVDRKQKSGKIVKM